MHLAHEGDKWRHPENAAEKKPLGFYANLLTCLRLVSFQENLCPVELFSKVLIVSGE
jgi:hypothetical protein